MRIIARYITKEILLSFGVITTVLLMVVLSNRFAQYLTKAASGELPIKLVFQIAALYVPEFLGYLIPLGLLMAILFGLGRLYADSEMTVLFACGVRVTDIMRLVLLIAIGVMLVTAALTVWIVPYTAQLRENVLAEGQAFGAIQSVLPGRFQPFSDGRLVFYVEEITAKKEAVKGVWIAERPHGIEPIENARNSGWVLLTSEEAQVKRNAQDGAFYLVLKNGQRYQGIPGAADYTVVSFAEYGRKISDASALSQGDSLRMQKSFSLWGSKNPVDIAELQWRFSLPLTVPILALLATPLSRVSPRHGRFARFLPAIALYIIYYNLFTISKRWVAAGVLPGFIGVWWVHLVFLVIGIGLSAHLLGWSRPKIAHKIFK